MVLFQRFRLTSVIVALNVAVFLAWIVGDKSDSGFMAQNFLVSWDALREGRYWTLITSEFSHLAFFHIFLNMFVLRSFGPILEMALGRGRFLFFYLPAAVVASVCHSTVSAFLLGAPELPALGASGAISGLVLLFALMFPRERLLIFGIIPIPAIWGAVLFVGLDTWGLVAQARGGGLPIGFGAHLGGALTGLLFFLLYVRKRLRLRFR
jgi:membrane associated rhomboid family serine protease